MATTLARGARGAGKLAVGGAAAVAGMAVSSSAEETADCYSHPLPSEEEVAVAVDLLKPPGTLVKRYNDDEVLWHDVDTGMPDADLLDLLARAQSAIKDPAVAAALAPHCSRQPMVERMMTEQPRIRSNLPSAPQVGESAVLVEPADCDLTPLDEGVQSLSSFGDLSESFMVEVNESLQDLRAENAALRQENAALRAEAGHLPSTNESGPVHTRIKISDNGRCALTLRLRAADATAPASPRDTNEPEWLEGALQALAQPPVYSAPVEALRETMEAGGGGPGAREKNTVTDGVQGVEANDGRREWNQALVLGAVVIVGTLAIALRNPKLVSIAVKKAAVALSVLVATFRVPL